MNTYLRSKIVLGIDYMLFAASFWISRTAKEMMRPIKHPEIQDFVKKHGYFSIENPLVGRVTASKKDLELCCAFLKKLESLIEDPQARAFAELEILVKIIAYRNLEIGDVLPLGEGLFTVDQKFDLYGGMPAWGLISSNGSAPILLFRGTDFSCTSRASLASVHTDLDVKGPGYTTFLKARPQLSTWIKSKQPRAYGHSLGGALACYTVLFEGEHLHPTLPSIAFNPPGVFSRGLKLWHQRQHPPLITYDTKGDLVSKVGRLVGDVREIALPFRARPIQAHVGLLFGEEF